MKPDAVREALSLSSGCGTEKPHDLTRNLHFFMLHGDDTISSTRDT